MTPIPLSLYIHIPWCVKKCPYCDFNSHQADQKIPEEKYILALLRDLEHELPHIWGRPIESVFIGGGTPSLLTAQAVDHLIRGLRERLNLKPNTEITMEANPGTFEQERFSAYRELGINRLSIGVQSFNDNDLKQLGRIHNATEAITATNIAKKAGFKNINLDLMFGLPEQNTTQALSDLQQAIACKPTHISWYQLTIEKNTLFYHTPPLLPEDDFLWKIQQQGQVLLEKFGFHQYEVSAYAQKDQECRHNKNYWQFGDYLGIGAGAHSKLTMPNRRVTRHNKYRHPNKYMQETLQQNPHYQRQILTERDLTFEFMLNALRLKQGFSQNSFEKTTFIKFSIIQEKINTQIEAGLLKKQCNKYITTKKGWAFIDSIVGQFI